MFGFLNYKNYEYEERHNAVFLDHDRRMIRGAFLITFVVMFLILMLVVFVPSTRYDSGIDNLPKLIICSIGAFFGFLLCTFPIRHLKYNKLRNIISRVFLAFYFIILTMFSFFFSDAKADAVFTYLIYCVICAVLLHMNPVFYLLQTVVVGAATMYGLYQYFDSLGAMFSWLALLISIVYLVYISNNTVHQKISDSDKIEDYKVKLELELQEKTAQLVDGMARQTAIQENVILAIADLVENRDTDTGTHIKATSYYAELIAQGAMLHGLYPDELDDEFVYLIGKAAPMHDLGKIMIPDEILKAPRRLTSDEFEIMKRHAVEGARVIRHVYDGIETPEYIEVAANVANYHHERWDGSGYPEGLSGINIPLEARIMAIADVFDALVSKRCYKDSFPLEDAFDEIKNNSGKQFDPDLVDIFLSHHDEIEKMIVSDFNS